MAALFACVQRSFESCCPIWFLDELYSFNPPKRVQLLDKPLGVFQHLGQMIVLCVLLYNFIFAHERYNAIEIDGGSITELDFVRLDFNSMRNKSFADTEYCDAPKYDYFPPTPENRRHDPSSYWNDNKIACKQAMFADLISLDASNQNAQLMTFEKFTRGVTQSCRASDKCERQSNRSTVLKGGGGADGEAFVLREKDIGGEEEYSCTCLEYRNYFAMRPEGVGLKLHHNYTTGFEKINGGSMSMDKTLAPITIVKRKPNIDHKVYSRTKAFNSPDPKGQAVRLSVKEILEFAFAVPEGTVRSPLDERVTSGGVALVEGEKPPFRRLTGVQINMELTYKIEMDYSKSKPIARPVCELQISYAKGMTSWLPPAQIHEQISLNTEQTYDRTYTEVLRRGIVFNITSRSEVWTFSWKHIFELLIEIAVVLPLVTVVTELLARYVHPNKRVYAPAIRQPLQYEREMRRFAAMSALASSAFKSWDLDSDGKIRFEELWKLFAAHGASSEGRTKSSASEAKMESARQFAAVLCGGRGADDGITQDELIETMTDDLVHLDGLQQYSARRAKGLDKCDADDAGHSSDLIRVTPAGRGNPRRRSSLVNANIQYPALYAIPGAVHNKVASAMVPIKVASAMVPIKANPAGREQRLGSIDTLLLETGLDSVPNAVEPASLERIAQQMASMQQQIQQQQQQIEMQHQQIAELLGQAAGATR
jgi:hypothetical protein